MALYSSNLTKEDEHFSDCSGAGAPSCFSFQPPRTIGVEVTWHPQPR